MIYDLPIVHPPSKEILYIYSENVIPTTERTKIKATKICVCIPKKWNPSEHEALSLKKYLTHEVTVKTIGLPWVQSCNFDPFHLPEVEYFMNIVALITPFWRDASVRLFCGGSSPWKPHTERWALDSVTLIDAAHSLLYTAVVLELNDFPEINYNQRRKECMTHQSYGSHISHLLGH